MNDLLENYDYKSHSYVSVTGTEDWETVADLGEGGYEWTKFKAFYSPSARRYFWHGGSGCSCNGWSDGLSTSADFEDGDRAALLRAWEAFAKDHSYTFSADDYVAGVTEIRNYKESR